LDIESGEKRKRTQQEKRILGVKVSSHTYNKNKTAGGMKAGGEGESKRKENGFSILREGTNSLED